ncbi:hypothetical protein [Klebsiella quasipneumoniae]|uniref:hypothetical protein n=1 Tax=Klebsiella quasipneumoniae TaxID=1463165 RepID=UPI000F6B651D|nr:hypothetical protein [Klebsiella quasipneumoniae]MDR4548087.1 hypothetical protein [Klebsiella quasipneumoniae]VEB92629.1 Uncharacterised protein [Klebsiella quasipneumoniae]HBR2128551.1 hypothetical protein [Klebsiella variicola]
MTSKLTRERLQEIAEDGFLKHGESKELARIARAAMDSGPVAYADPQAFENVEAGSARREWMWKNPDADLVPLYRHAQPAPVLPDGYVMVPKEPTESMVIAGFESEPDEFFSESEVWEAFQKMSGCEQAAFRARLCWAAMLAAAPQEVKGE